MTFPEAQLEFWHQSGEGSDPVMLRLTKGPTFQTDDDFVVITGMKTWNRYWKRFVAGTAVFCTERTQS